MKRPSKLTSEQQIKTLLDRVIAIQEQERRRLALDLHDQLGQQLTTLRLALTALRDATNEHERSRHFDHVDQIVLQLDRDVDFLAWELRPPALDEIPLIAVVAEFVQQWSQRTGVMADFHHVPTDLARLSGETAANLYRIVQEALNNVAKHSRAQKVSIIFERRGNDLILIVEDDGVGFDSADQRVRRRGIGLAGIQDRTAAISGTFEIESSPGKGTTLFVRLPVGPRSQAKVRRKR